MVALLSPRIAEQVLVAAGLYHRLILVVVPPRIGRATAFRESASEQSWPMENVNLSLPEKIIQEDEKLLLYDDVATMRLGDDT